MKKDYLEIKRTVAKIQKAIGNVSISEIMSSCFYDCHSSADGESMPREEWDDNYCRYFDEYGFDYLGNGLTRVGLSYTCKSGNSYCVKFDRQKSTNIMEFNNYTELKNAFGDIVDELVVVPEFIHTVKKKYCFSISKLGKPVRKVHRVDPRNVLRFEMINCFTGDAHDGNVVIDDRNQIRLSDLDLIIDDPIDWTKTFNKYHKRYTKKYCTTL